MKKFFYGVMALALTAGFSSCNDSDPNFTIYYGVLHGVQWSDTEFQPVVGYTTVDGTLVPSASSISRDGLKLNTKSLDKYGSTLEVVPQKYTSLEDLKGTYSFVAVADDGQESNASVTYSQDKALGAFEIDGSVTYTDGKLKMTIAEEVENATHYGFYCRPILDGAVAETWLSNVTFRQPAKDTSGKPNLVVEGSPTFYGSFEGYFVYPAAMIITNDDIKLVRVFENKAIKIEKNPTTAE